MQEVHSDWNWALSLGFLNNKFSLTWWLGWNALPLLGLNYKVGQADMPDCPWCGSGLEGTAECTYYCEQVWPFWNHVWEWMACVKPKQLMLLNIGYVIDNVLPPYQGEKHIVSLVILAVARMVIWTTQKKGLYFSSWSDIYSFSISLDSQLDMIENAWTT